MPPQPEHPFDGIADDLFDWMQGEVDYHVAALRGGYRAPFSAQVTEKDKLDYYRRQMFQTTPDGTIQYDKPNAQGRDQLLKTVGTQTYAEIWQTVKPKQGRNPMLELTGEANPPDEEEDQQDVPLQQSPDQTGLPKFGPGAVPPGQA